MIAAAIPYILQGASALGGLLGRKKVKTIDPEYLRTHFGPEAIAKQAQELSQRILASPYGQQLMSSAAESGQQLQSDMAQRAAQSGLSPDTGGQSGASDFATSAAAGAQSAFERGAKANIFQQALPIAQDLVSQQAGAYAGGLAALNAQPSVWSHIGTVAGQAASLYPTSGGGTQTPTPPVAAPVTSSIPTPQLSISPQAPVLNAVGSQPAVDRTNASGFGRGSVARRYASGMPQIGAVRGRGSLAMPILR